MQRRSGQTLILFTLALLPVCGLIGLVVDVGWAYFRSEAAKTASDAAANAAAAAAFANASGGSITCGTAGVACYSADYTCPSTFSPGLIDNITAGCLYARDNGFTTSATQTVKFRSGVGNPPGSTGVSVGYWTTATVTEQIPQTFSAALGFPTATVAAKTISGAQNPAAGGGGCIFALRTTGSSAVSLSGGAIIQSGCGVYVNSSSTSAALLLGSAGIITTGGAKTRIVGNWSGSGGSYISPSPQTGIAAITDPWAAMAEPTVGACTDGGAGVRIGSSTNLTISPGVICGGIAVSGSAILNMNAGLYIVKAGVSLGNSGRIIGTGVTIYVNTGGVSISGASITSLTAPSSGTWQGVALFQSRSNSTANSMTGGANMNVNGLLYFPAAALTYSGGTSTGGGTTATIVANTISLTGSSYIKTAATTAYSPSLGGTVVIQ